MNEAIPAGPRPGRFSHQTRPEDVVSWRQRWGIGLGKMVEEAMQNCLHLLTSPILNMTLGVSPAALSTLIFLQRVWDAFIDPVVGSYSDNFRSRWGRRRPLMLVAAPLMASLFVGIWFFPREASTTYLFVHVLIFSLLFYSAYAFYCTPLAGLTLEATDDYHERTRLVSFIFIFGFIANLAVPWLFPATQLSIFPDTITGLRWVTALIGGFFLAAALLSVWLCRERLYAKVAAKQPSLSLWKSIGLARAVPNFSALVFARFFYTFGYNVVGILALYMNTYYVFGGDVKTSSFAFGFLGGTYHLAGILVSVLIFPPLARRLGKLRVFQLSTLVLVGGCLSKLVLYRPGEPWWQFIVLGANGVATAGMNLSSYAMLGDIADNDELINGVRREAMLGAIVAWIEKAGRSLGMLLSGFILVWIGFDAKLGMQSQTTLELMKYSYVVLPMFGALAALFLTRKISLSEDEAYATTAALAERRAKL